MLENKEYFRKHKYRDPRDGVVKSYVIPKIRFMEKNGCLRGANPLILDVGSGNGTFSWYFEKYSQRVISLDNSEELLGAHPGRLKARADVYQLPFKDGQFDLVFEANLLHHLDRPIQAIQELMRCSRDYIVLIEPNRYNPLMFLFALLVKEERGVWVSSKKRWKEALTKLGVKVLAEEITGMISQQNTPVFLIPFLKIFDFDFPLGEYIVLICRKNLNNDGIH